MIVPMKRILLLCVDREVDSTLRSLRDLGAVHLDLSAGGGECAASANGDLEDAEKALRLVRKAVKELGVADSSNDLSVSRILELDARREELKNAAEALKIYYINFADIL